VSKRSTKEKSSGKSSKKQGMSPSTLILFVILVAVLYLLQQFGIIDLGLFATPTPTGVPPVSTAGGEPTAPTTTVMPPISTTEGEPAAGWYQVYFTTPKYPDEEKDHVGGLDEKLVEAVNKAESSIDIAAYDFDLENVAQALVKAQENGVRVRFVTDTDNVDLDAIKMLEKADIPVVQDDRGAIMHDKFVVIDKKIVWTGSWNLTVNGTYRNNNNVMVINSPSLAANYTAEFEEMFADEAFGPRSPANTPHPQLTINGVLVENYFAPEDEVMDKIVAQLEKAQKSVQFMAFSFTDDRMGQVLRDKAKAGLKVQGLFEKRGSDTEYSEYGILKKQKMDVLTDANRYILHHKVVIIDEATVILGSFNFSESADESNDENILIVHDADVAESYLSEFQRLYQQATAVAP
jgi:phosphatidylserine/phosphatidylglycerophosphate/cardiolipin synthase-like enzyme